jgi:dTDP-L-rhamnose 4-epimerase
MESILITGGAGFIGSHLATELIGAGYHVRALDSLVGQVHGDTTRPAYLDSDVELQVGDVRDPTAVRRALQGVDAVVHFAARVGVGQSMYEAQEYVSANALGTAVLLESLADTAVERLVVASSMSIYGEGLYSPVQPRERTTEDLEAHCWEPVAESGQPVTACPTPESKQAATSSVYALTKYDQERLCLVLGEANRIPTVALRFFNVYGPHQALSNPYTGVLAIFAARLLNGRPPLVYEDGLQRRDFVSVHDVARACRLALERQDVRSAAINIGSGESVTVLELADRLAHVLGSPIEAEVSGMFRVGDIRHCFADIRLAEERLGFRPEVTLEDGLEELAAWIETQSADDGVEAAREELLARGLAR